MEKIISKTEAANSGQFHRVEIEVHAYRRNNEPLSGIELICDQQEAFKSRRQMMIVNLTIEAAMILRDQLIEVLERGEA